VICGAILTTPSPKLLAIYPDILIVDANALPVFTIVNTPGLPI
jgi:hypothetical protein